jgi:hypothetical protein
MRGFILLKYLSPQRRLLQKYFFQHIQQFVKRIFRHTKIRKTKYVRLAADLHRMYGTGVSVILSLTRLNQAFYSISYFLALGEMQILETALL